MPKDQKTVTQQTPSQDLPMPKYSYQAPQAGSVSSHYQDEEKKAQQPAHELHNVHFG